jgi:hypothetical protein
MDFGHILQSPWPGMACPKPSPGFVFLSSARHGTAGNEFSCKESQLKAVIHLWTFIQWSPSTPVELEADGTVYDWFDIDPFGFPKLLQCRTNFGWRMIKKVLKILNSTKITGIKQDKLEDCHSSVS